MVTFSPSLSDILKFIETVESSLIHLLKRLHSGDIPELNSVLYKKLHMCKVYNLMCWHMYTPERLSQYDEDV